MSKKAKAVKAVKLTAAFAGIAAVGFALGAGVGYLIKKSVESN